MPVDPDFQRDIQQLKDTVEATAAMLNQVMVQIKARSLAVPSRGVGDTAVITQLILMADHIQNQFNGIQANLDLLLGCLTADGPLSGDVPEDPA